MLMKHEGICRNWGDMMLQRWKVLQKLVSKHHKFRMFRKLQSKTILLIIISLPDALHKFLDQLNTAFSIHKWKKSGPDCFWHCTMSTAFNLLWKCGAFTEMNAHKETLEFKAKCGKNDICFAKSPSSLLWSFVWLAALPGSSNTLILIFQKLQKLCIWF